MGFKGQTLNRFMISRLVTVMLVAVKRDEGKRTSSPFHEEKGPDCLNFLTAGTTATGTTAATTDRVC